MLFIGYLAIRKRIEDIQQKPASTVQICQMPTVEDLSVAREPRGICGNVIFVSVLSAFSDRNLKVELQVTYRNKKFLQNLKMPDLRCFI